MDADGDLDAFVANIDENTLWLNNNGVFIKSNQPFGTTPSLDAIFGDLDNDGSLDILVTNNQDNNKIWFNDDSGTFSNNFQIPNSKKSRGGAFGDVDADGDLDIVIVNEDGLNEIWLNNWIPNTERTFTPSPYELSHSDSNSYAVSFADVNNDGYIDFFTPLLAVKKSI